jgi:predicted dehydrogenase
LQRGFIQSEMRGPPFGIAVVGGGAIGELHIDSFRKHPAGKVVALVEANPARGRAVARRREIPVLLQDYREALARPDIQVVSIALPNYLHAAVALDALRAGKHVVIDKPMTTDARSAARLANEARRRGLVLMVGQNQRFSPEVQTLKQHVERGTLGEVYHARTCWMRRAGIPRIGSWFTQRRFAGGGCTYDIGVHMLDQALHLVGEFDAVAVSGQTYAKFGPRGRGNGKWGRSEIDPGRPFDVEDSSITLIRLRSGRTVLLEVSWAGHQAKPDVSGTQLFGTEAGATTEPLQLFRPGRPDYRVEKLPLLRPRVNPDRMVHFLQVLLGEEKLLVTPAESVAVQRILDAIYRSAATGREVRLR